MVVDRKITWINQRCCTMTGYDTKELINQNSWLLYPNQQDYESVFYKNREQIAQKGVSLVETQCRKKNGEIMDILLGLAPLDLSDWSKGLIFSARDITEQKRAYNLLKESERTYREIFNASNDVIFVHDLDSGKILDVNSQVKSLYGYEPEQVIQMNIQQISAGERPYTGEDSLEWLRKCVKEGPQVFEWLAKGRDGKHFWVEISLKQAAVGGVDCTLAVVRDISKRKDAELELSEYRTHLEKMVRQRTAELEAKNRELETFTYSVSHDLKAPLRGIDGYSRLLEEDYSDKLDEEGLLFIKNVRLSAGRMNQLIEDLLAYSRMERRQIIPVGIDIYALIEGILCQRARDIESNGIRVRVDLPFQTVNTDPPTLLQVLDNYIDNAVKFSKKLAPGSVEVGGREDQNSWTLWVKDNGIGFDPVYHDRIFGIFQRLHRPEDFPGTGVGLAIVYKAAERINARVWAQSKVNEGATFFIAIPKKISVERSLVDI